MSTKLFILIAFLSLFSACERSAATLNEVPAQGAAFATATPEKTDLRSWIGKYPVDPSNKTHQNLFEDKQLKPALLEILKNDGFAKLTARFKGLEKIKEIEGFLVAVGSAPSEDDTDYGMLAVNINSGDAFVYFVDNKKLTVFSKAAESSVPAAVTKQILIYSDAGQIKLIGTLKNKPEEGFPCYAVVPEEFDKKADERALLFVATDNGGTFNVNGEDVSLKAGKMTDSVGESKKKYVEWNFENADIKAKFDMGLEKTFNEGADEKYSGTLTITTRSNTQTIQIVAFCGG